MEMEQLPDNLKEPFPLYASFINLIIRPFLPVQVLPVALSNSVLIQKTVPSDTIMIGGSFVFGLDTSANSLPP